MPFLFSYIKDMASVNNYYQYSYSCIYIILGNPINDNKGKEPFAKFLKNLDSVNSG